MELDFYIVDAFVDKSTPFTGNPAVVIPLEKDDLIDDRTKQKIAAEFNLSETAFVSKKENDDGSYLLRWFTPTNEVNLCGHATMATSYVLAKYGQVESQSKTFKFDIRTGSRLVTTVENDCITMEFPTADCNILASDQYADLVKTIKEATVGKDHVHKIIDVMWSSSTKKLLFRLECSENNDFLVNIKPNFDQLKKINTGGAILGLIVTQKACFEKHKVHFWSRYFASWNGIDEDPVTGSAHTVLVPYWLGIYSKENQGKLVKTFVARQVSKRGGLVECGPVNGNVFLKGNVRAFCQGKLKI